MKTSPAPSPFAALRRRIRQTLHWLGLLHVVVGRQPSAATATMKAYLERHYGVPADVHPGDYVFQHMLRAGTGDDHDRQLQVYIMQSRSDAEKLAALVSRLLPEQRPRRLLDFAAGYGRIARHFRVLLPDDHVTTMDIHPEAVAFNRDVLGLDSLASDHDPRRLPQAGPFDAIIAISFFSHLRREAFGPWLARLADMLAPGGVLMATMHGQASLAGPMSRVQPGADGYGFVTDSDQDDLSTRHYVSAVTLRPFVETAVAKLDGVTIAEVEEGAWMGHQDLYILRRNAILP